MKLKFDLKVENFDRLFALKVEALTHEERAKLPAAIYGRLFRRNGKMSTKPFNFLQMMYVLTVAKNEEIFLVINGDDGVGIEGFEKFKRQMKNKIVDEEQADYYISKGAMVLSSKDLAMYMSQVNRSSISPIYNYLLKLKNTKVKKNDQQNGKARMLVDMLISYESNKRKMAQMGFEAQDIIVLLFLYDGCSKTPKETYEKVFKETPMCSRINILTAYKKMNHLGYIEAQGRGTGLRYIITALGMATVNDLITKFILP